MIYTKAWMRLLALSTIALTVGCAPAYHDYADCYVDCKYCVPPPLPYVHYPDCVCHACVVSKYLSEQPQISPAVAEVRSDEIE